ncbi:hypothetical protein [Burkholderia ubonensis]|uniref:hypothetical protein n=1 Tax=Burkholderia ubonensis TaxID=101571 RepID=UPI00075EC545|nr:hypothetical protein [Burkholderia ubonensis]KVO86089.1 hypothetical protein WJ82_14950 [Burkholderia ubonensis]
MIAEMIRRFPARAPARPRVPQARLHGRVPSSLGGLELQQMDSGDCWMAIAFFSWLGLVELIGYGSVTT